MDSKTQSFAETVAEKLIKQLREGTAPWQKPWMPGEAGTCLPMNPITGNRYKGINALLLLSEGREDQRWMTYNQAAAVEAQVRKGEKGTRIQYWKFTEEQTMTDSAGKPILDARGEAVKESVKLERPRVFFATVFNAEQIDGLPPMERKEQSWNAVDLAEQILKASGAEVLHGEHDRAFYRTSSDSIHLPDKAQFPDAESYYATALHELGHWTGHELRLNRDLVHPFGSEGYAREELRAEIASMILGDELGIGHDPEQHAAYVGSWIKALQDDPLEIFRAAAEAEKIQDYVLGIERTLVQNEAAQRGRQYAQRAFPMATPSQDYSTEVEMDMPLPESGNKAVAQRAETWTVDRIKQGSLLRALDQATVKQVERMQGILTDMQPFDGENLFWQRHVLPEVPGLQQKVHEASELATYRLMDAALASARLGIQVTRTSGAEHDVDSAKFARESEPALGFILPHDWNGKVITQRANGGTATTSSPSSDTQASWDVYAQRADGVLEFMKTFGRERDAVRLAERLALIDAHSTINEHEKAAKLARINEERVRRDPNSTDEDISAAREMRKNAIFSATRNDEDLQRRIDAEERIKQQAPSVPSATDKRFLNVPFKQKDEAKALGAKWDRQQQSWYIPSGLDRSAFAKWSTEAREQNLDIPEVSARQYLAVPYSAREEAKAAGAEWDKVAKSWFAGPKANMAKLEQWIPENVMVQQGPAMTPRDEFAEALKSVGCVVSGEHPIMDGASHRITVEGEKFTQKSGSGFYVGHLDGHPAGYVKNNKTGADLTWKAKGYVLDPEKKARLAAAAAIKFKEREADLFQRQEQAAARVARQLEKLLPVEQPTAYMLEKGIEPDSEVRTDKDGKKTYVPAIDVNGKHWSTQYIQTDGTKRFAKESKKEGCFHVVGGLDQLAAAPAIVIGEGYATAASLKQTLGFATVSAFDSGNLAHVAQALHLKFPEKPIVIAGDDDRYLEATQGVNPGRSKAKEAASAVNGKVLLPIFAPGENSYPAELDPVTPKLFRAHQKGGNALSDEQIAGLARMKQFTDFNDLATKSALRIEGIERQVRSAVADIVEKHRLALIEQPELAQVKAQIEELAPAPEPTRRRVPKIA